MPLLAAVLAGAAAPAPAAATAWRAEPVSRLASSTGGGILFSVAAT
jgi:hypothetical protein